MFFLKITIVLILFISDEEDLMKEPCDGPCRHDTSEKTSLNFLISTVAVVSKRILDPQKSNTALRPWSPPSPINECINEFILHFHIARCSSFLLF